MLRVGSVPYLVARPLDLGLEHEAGIEVVREVPARLVEGLRAGTIDVALVSSIELFRREGYSYLDGIAVAGEGFVSSVQVFLRRPIGEVATVALDPASRTAACLAQVVWPGPERPAFREIPAGRDPRREPADAWLRIGDEALRERFAPGSPPVFNPAEVWGREIGLPFCFAAWIARPGVDLEPWAPAFARAWDFGRARIGELARRAAGTWGVPPAAASRYFRDEVLYRPADRLTPSLLAFRDRSAELGLCRGDLDPEAVPAALPDGTGARL